jgi:secondary thiamine-phosphate synthase enzyme
MIHELQHNACRVLHNTLDFCTEQPLQFIDITDKIHDVVSQSGIADGILNVQSLHTTASIVVNENEPFLLQDMRLTLERLAPKNGEYFHNDFSIRTVNMSPDEDQNGDAHCKGLFLPTSVCVNVVKGDLVLGLWQRIFLVELDHARARKISITIIGT